MASREELIRIQKRIVRNLKREINELTGADVPPIRQYLREYEREFKHFRQISSKAALIRAARRAQIVYVGDFHTLRISQKAAGKLLTELMVSNRRVVLGLEMIQSRHQAMLTSFLKGEISEGKLLREVDYAHTWGFDWTHYRDILHFAREHGLEAVGLNCSPQRVRNRLRARDEHAARILASITLDSPDTLLFVIFGDLHVAQCHLPQAVDRIVALHDEHRRKVIVYQNNETVYWRLAAVGLEETVTACQIDRESFCIFNTTPLVKFHSVLNWTEKLDELPQKLPPGWEADGGERIDYSDFVVEICQVIAEFLGIEEQGLQDFYVYTSTDLDLLETLERDHGFDEDELRRVEEELLISKSFFHPKGNIIYLSSLSVNRAAEEASRFINSIKASHRGVREDALDEFYFRVMTEAIGFLGSKVLNHKRKAKRPAHYQEIRDKNRGRFLTEKSRLFDTVCRWVLEHQRMEEAMLGTDRVPALSRRIFHQPRAVQVGTCNAIGHILGERLYNAMIDERVSKEQIRALFHENLEEPRKAVTVYRDLVTFLERNHRDRRRERPRFDLPPTRFPITT
jgi:hypothetical protein